MSNKQASRTAYGVTPPVSTNFPVEAEIQATEALKECLRSFGQYESDEEAHSRYIFYCLKKRLGIISSLVLLL